MVMGQALEASFKMVAQALEGAVVESGDMEDQRSFHIRFRDGRMLVVLAEPLNNPYSLTPDCAFVIGLTLVDDGRSLH